MPRQDFQTGFAGIIVRVDPAVSPVFPQLVTEALQTINSRPVGAMLLQAIVSNGQPMFGYKVCIMRPIMAVGPDANGRRDWKGGSRAVRIREDLACDGTGTPTMIEWNPNVINNPDGARPPFIGLAHELVHALHNLLGSAAADTRTEEEMTVGLNAWLQVPPNENMIRREHNVPHRARYDSDEFQPVVHDAAQFGRLFGQP